MPPIPAVLAPLLPPFPLPPVPVPKDNPQSPEKIALGKQLEFVAIDENAGVRHLDVALELMAEGSRACNRRVEVRSILNV